MFQCYFYFSVALWQLALIWDKSATMWELRRALLAKWQVNGPDLVRKNKSFHLIASINVNSWLHKVEIKQNFNLAFRVIKDSVLCAGKHNLDLRGTFSHQWGLVLYCKIKRGFDVLWNCTWHFRDYSCNTESNRSQYSWYVIIRPEANTPQQAGRIFL